MFSRQHLDSPPPQSQFRRPWSPDPYDPYPSVTHNRNYNPDTYSPEENAYDLHQEYPQYPSQQHHQSDASVEALDLADYARTLRPHHQDPQPSPPSLVSRGDTLSSTSTPTTHRPFSLPPASRHSPYSSRNALPPSHRSHNYPYLTEPEIVTSPDSEHDISQFPPWSRSWYNLGGIPMSPPDIYTPLPASVFDPKRKSTGLFDPSQTAKRAQQFDSDLYSTSYGLESTRDLLPWSSDPPEYGPSIDDNLKAERIRMLEREFGPNAKPGQGSKAGDFLDENGKPLVGTVDEKGNLVTKSPGKRVAARVLQIICAIAAAIPSIYAAAFMKVTPAPPPAGTLAAYVLYVVSVITLFALLFVFMVYPCCIRRNKRSGAKGAANPLANGMMVLPVQGLPGGKKNKKGGKGKKGKGNMPGGDVQVNLIVDPNIFGGNREEEEEDEDDDTWDWEGSSVPGGWGRSSNGGGAKKKQRRAKRRSVFVGLAMEEEWKKARSFAKKIMAFDMLGILLWGTVFVIILLGKRCPIGGFNGWCNAYNVSSAAACLLCIFFGLSVFFDIQDLHMSKESPRTRT